MINHWGRPKNVTSLKRCEAYIWMLVEMMIGMWLLLFRRWLGHKALKGPKLPMLWSNTNHRNWSPLKQEQTHVHDIKWTFTLAEKSIVLRMSFLCCVATLATNVQIFFFVVCTNQGLAKTKVTGHFENIWLVFVFASVFHIFVCKLYLYFVQMHWYEIQMRCPGQEHGIVCLHPLFSDNLNVSPQPNVFASSIS